MLVGEGDSSGQMSLGLSRLFCGRPFLLMREEGDYEKGERSVAEARLVERTIRAKEAS